MNLSEHFTKEELTYSDTAKANNINNEPNSIQLKVLKHTCEYFLEPLRTLFNKDYKKYQGKDVKAVIIKITSGLRTLPLNRKIGSKDNSQHITGEAIDLDIIILFKDGSKKTLPYTETYSYIKRNVKEGKISIDQCIQESSNGIYWVHCSYKAGGASVNRKQFLVYKNGKYSLD